MTITHSQLREQKSVQPSRRSAVNPARTFTRAGVRSIRAHGTAASVNVSVSQAMTHAEPQAATSTPPARPGDLHRVLADLQQSVRRVLYRGGDDLDHHPPPPAGVKNADAAPHTVGITTRCHTCAEPNHSSSAATPSVSAHTTLAHTITRALDHRSATTPPTNNSTICGPIPAASTRPRALAPPPWCRTAKARPIGATVDPAHGSTRVKKCSRNCRSPSGLKESMIVSGTSVPG